MEDFRTLVQDRKVIRNGAGTVPARDPLAQETLEQEDYHWLGESMRKLGLPVFSLLEGGYSNDLPELILAYLKGLDGR